MSIKSFARLVEELQKRFAEGKALVCPVIHKADYSPIDNYGNVVAFKIKGFWNCMSMNDVIDYATMGGTNA